MRPKQNVGPDLILYPICLTSGYLAFLGEFIEKKKSYFDKNQLTIKGYLAGKNCFVLFV